ncbi:MAG: methylated-DNA--[protein]-cysteine S-methyltransferase [Acetatifactor sp.]|nr:methylated-DNA--[protein]-cysteine S-methyltransferase [Acetatifactor sp.]
MIYAATYESPIGELFLAAEDEVLIGLWIKGQKYFPTELFSEQVRMLHDHIPIGTITRDQPLLCGLEKEYKTDSAREDCEILSRARTWLDQYFAGERPWPGILKLAPGRAPGILPVNSEFRQQVWKLLLEIPYGEVLTYGELARRLAQRRGLSSMSAQAVGGAVGHNPLSIIIPCHRVVGADGSLTGYAGGVEKKRWLLKLEGVLEE